MGNKEKTMENGHGKARMGFLDADRYALVFLVVVLHAACAYSHIIPWWHASDPAQGHFYDGAIIALDLFLMPVLFFIAGYFALPSLARRTGAGFALAKLRRFGIPLAVLVVFYLPMMIYLGYLMRVENPVAFWPFWLRLVGTIGDLRVLVLDTMEKMTPLLFDVSQHYLWFISLLLIFFLVLALLRPLFRLDREGRGRGAEASGGRMLLALLVAWIVMGAAGGLCLAWMSDFTWIRWSGLVLFQPTRMPVYVGFFVLGMFAWKRGWFKERTLPGPAWLWLLLFLGLEALVLEAAFRSSPPMGAYPLGPAMGIGFVRTLAALAGLGVCLTLPFGRFAKNQGFHGAMTAASYDVYLLHMPIVCLIPWLLTGVALPVFLKFVIAILGTMAASLAVSKWLMQPRPWAALALLMAVFGAVCVFG